MRKRPNKRQLERIGRLADIICELRKEFDEENTGHDVQLHYGNGTVSEQLSCAAASLDCILQEF